MSQQNESELKRWFKPFNELGEAGNSILYRGLQGSPQFESSEDFFHKLESAIRSGAGESRALPAPALQTSKYFAALPGTSDVIRRFNRDTKWLATLVVGAVVSAALILAVLLQERHPRADDLTKEARLAEGDLLLNADSATRFTVADFSGKRSTRKMTSGQATSVDHAFTEISPQEDPSSQMEALASTPTSVLAFTPKINRQDVQANASSRTLSHRQDSGRVLGLKVPRASSSVRPRSVDVKMRLIALWHQSLMRTERSRSWTLFSNSNKGDKKKVSYIAKTNH